MKMMLDIVVNGKLNNEDIIVYRDNRWINIPKDFYLSSVYKEINNLKTEIEEMNVEMKEYKEKVNKKLEEYHRILQVLTKED